MDKFKAADEFLLKTGILPLWLIVIVLEFIIIKFVLPELSDKCETSKNVKSKKILFGILIFIAFGFAIFILFFMFGFSFSKSVKNGILNGTMWCFLGIGFAYFLLPQPAANKNEPDAEKKIDGPETVKIDVKDEEKNDVKLVQTKYEKESAERKKRFVSIIDWLLEKADCKSELDKSLPQKIGMLLLMGLIYILAIPFLPFMLIKSLFTKLKHSPKKSASVFLEVLKRLGYLLLSGLGLAVTCYAALYLFPVVYEMAGNIAAKNSKEAVPAVVKYVKHREYKEDINVSYCIVEYEKDGQPVTEKIYSGTFVENIPVHVNQHVTICRAWKSYKIKEMSSGIILNDIFYIIPYAAAFIMFGLGTLACIGSVIFGSEWDIMFPWVKKSKTAETKRWMPWSGRKKEL